MLSHSASPPKIDQTAIDVSQNCGCQNKQKPEILFPIRLSSVNDTNLITYNINAAMPTMTKFYMV